VRVLREIRPDIFHAHYVVEHGFYGSLTGVRPYVVTAWGSDLLRDSYTPLGKLIARWVLRHADLVTGNDPYLLQRARELGAAPEKTALVRLGVDGLFLDAHSVNQGPAAAAPATLISDRALEPLYNIEAILRAFSSLRETLPDAVLLVAGDGSQRAYLEALARRLGLDDSVRFLGQLGPEALRDALASAHVYVSVPSSDSMSVSNLEAMAVGAFPVLSDVPSLSGWIDDGVNGRLVPATQEIEPLAAFLSDALEDAFSDAARRQRAVSLNRARVEAEGMNERNMLLLERQYYKLAGHPVSDEGVI
jgi:glycosyltransferase involved in cell wall biosynthesis